MAIPVRPDAGGPPLGFAAWRPAARSGRRNPKSAPPGLWLEQKFVAPPVNLGRAFLRRWMRHKLGPQPHRLAGTTHLVRGGAL